MKKKTLILAGILSGSMMLTMGTAMTASAEEANTTLTVAVEKTTENAENKEAPGKGMPPAFRLRDRSMQPPKENPQRNTDQQKSGNDGSGNQSKTDENGMPALPDGKTPNENGATGSKATSRFFKPNEKPQTKPDAENAAKDARDPWGTTDKDPYDAEHDPANGEAMKDDRQAMQNENGQPPQDEQSMGGQPKGKAPQGEQSQGEAPQGEQSQGEAPQGGQFQGEAPQDEQFQGEAPQDGQFQGEAPQDEQFQGEAPQGEAPQGEQFQGEAPQGGQFQGEGPQGGAPQGEQFQGEAQQGGPQGGAPQGGPQGPGEH